MRRLLIAAAIIGSVLLPSSAHADEGRDKKPVVHWPLNTTTTIQIQAPAKAWGLRKFAREVETLVPALNFDVTGKCSDRPKAQCIEVFVGHWDEEEMKHISGYDFGWYGLAKFPRPQRREIWLNAETRTWGRYAVAVHEFGHILGLGHHNRLGITGRTPDVTELSTPELRALRKAY